MDYTKNYKSLTSNVIKIIYECIDYRAQMFFLFIRQNIGLKGIQRDITLFMYPRYRK